MLLSRQGTEELKNLLSIYLKPVEQASRQQKQCFESLMKFDNHFSLLEAHQYLEDYVGDLVQRQNRETLLALLVVCYTNTLFYKNLYAQQGAEQLMAYLYRYGSHLNRISPRYLNEKKVVVQDLAEKRKIAVQEGEAYLIKEPAWWQGVFRWLQQFVYACQPSKRALARYDKKIQGYRYRSIESVAADIDQKKLKTAEQVTIECDSVVRQNLLTMIGRYLVHCFPAKVDAIQSSVVHLTDHLHQLLQCVQLLSNEDDRNLIECLLKHCVSHQFDEASLKVDIEILSLFASETCKIFLNLPEFENTLRFVKEKAAERSKALLKAAAQSDDSALGKLNVQLYAVNEQQKQSNQTRKHEIENGLWSEGKEKKWFEQQLVLMRQENALKVSIATYSTSVETRAKQDQTYDPSKICGQVLGTFEQEEPDYRYDDPIIGTFEQEEPDYRYDDPIITMTPLIEDDFVMVTPEDAVSTSPTSNRTEHRGEAVMHHEPCGAESVLASASRDDSSHHRDSGVSMSDHHSESSDDLEEHRKECKFLNARFPLLQQKATTCAGEMTAAQHGASSLSFTEIAA